MPRDPAFKASPWTDSWNRIRLGSPCELWRGQLRTCLSGIQLEQLGLYNIDRSLEQCLDPEMRDDNLCVSYSRDMHEHVNLNNCSGVSTGTSRPVLIIRVITDL